MALDQAVTLSVCFEVINRFDERDAGCLSQDGGDARSEFRMRVDPRTDRGASDGKLSDRSHRTLGSFDRQINLPSKSTELLAQPQRRGVG